MFVFRIFSSASSNMELWGYTDYPLTFDYIKLSFWLSNTHKLENIKMSQFVTVCLKQYFTKTMKQASQGRQINYECVSDIFLWDAGWLPVVTGVTFEL